jgi:hypothetical protein
MMTLSFANVMLKMENTPHRRSQTPVSNKPMFLEILISRHLMCPFWKSFPGLRPTR